MGIAGYVEDAFDYVRENIAKIMLLGGVFFVVVGALLLSGVSGEYTLASVSCLFVGILLIVFGFFVQVGVFSGSFCSLSGLGTILICSSVVLFVFAFVVFLIQDVNVIGFVREVFRGGVLPYYRMLTYTERPFLWLSVLCVYFGVFLFAGGFILKIYGFLLGEV